jgi:hypothetical protein
VHAGSEGVTLANVRGDQQIQVDEAIRKAPDLRLIKPLNADRFSYNRGA